MAAGVAMTVLSKLSEHLSEHPINGASHATSWAPLDDPSLARGHLSPVPKAYFVGLDHQCDIHDANAGVFA
eukprot:5491171-Amphidinium_carterae.3